MRIHTVLASLTLFYLGHGMPDSQIRDATSTRLGLIGRIVNGTKAAPRQFPHQVSLSRSWSHSHFCGGSIISPKLVLTAAHCMYLKNEEIKPWTIIVTGGILKLFGRTSTRQERGVEKISIHPMFNFTTLHNDVAVLRLSAPFTFTPEVRSVSLATSALVPNTICRVSGWGYPAQNKPIVSNDLMYVDLPIRSIDECRQLLMNISNVPSGMFCAGYDEGGRDACQGDSGGGMVCNGVLTGIVSGGEGCAFPRLPGVYADVYYYHNWIIDKAMQQRNNFRNFTDNGGNNGKLYNSAASRNNGEHERLTITAVTAIAVFLTLFATRS